MSRLVSASPGPARSASPELRAGGGRLHIVQPAVSQQIRRLERELSVPLFDHSSRHVRLTAAGECPLPEAREVLAAAGRARQVAAGIAIGADGIQRVGTSQGLGEHLDHILEQLRSTASGLEVRLVSAPVAERIARVRAGELEARSVAGRSTCAPPWTWPNLRSG